MRAKLYNIIQALYPFNIIEWQEIDGVTRGQLETVYMVKDLMNSSFSLAIFNCDTYFQSSGLSGLMSDNQIDGIIPCSLEPGDCWSFCKIDSEYNSNRIVDIAEKKRISEWASVGFYYFKDTKKFLRKAASQLAESADNEYYIAPFYKSYIDEDDNIVIDRVELFKPIGTPEQIEAYWEIDPSIIAQQNSVRKVLIVDLDNTLTIEDPNLPYSEKEANLAIIDKLNIYKNKGYEIIIQTARRMKTHNNDEARLIADIAEVTIQWLDKHNVPYDGLKFGKPYAENGFYIDDRAVRPDEFLQLSPEALLKLIASEK